MKNARDAGAPTTAWRQIIAEEDPTFGDEGFRKMRAARLDITLFGDPDDEVITTLDSIIHAYWIGDEDSFCEVTGRPRTSWTNGYLPNGRSITL